MLAQTASNRSQRQRRPLYKKIHRKVERHFSDEVSWYFRFPQPATLYGLLNRKDDVESPILNIAATSEVEPRRPLERPQRRFAGEKGDFPSRPPVTCLSPASRLYRSRISYRCCEQYRKRVTASEDEVPRLNARKSKSKNGIIASLRAQGEVKDIEVTSKYVPE